MNYSEDHIALAAEYALGTLSADERALVETMMIVDHGFMDVVNAWDRKLSPLHQMVAPVEPPPHLWDNIKSAIGLTGQPVQAVSESGSVEQPPEQPVQPPASSAVPDQFDYSGIGQPPPERANTASVHSGIAPTDDELMQALPMGTAAETSAAVPGQTASAQIASGQPPEPIAEPVAAAIAAGPVPKAAAEQSSDAVASNVVPLPDRKRGSNNAFGWTMTAVAASLAGVIALQAYRPDLLPEKLRVKPQIQVVEVAAPAQPQALPAQFVAVLQQGAAAPAFILTVDTATKNFTVRKVGAASEAGKSYELWLVSDKLQRPRSLGVIGGSDFTIRPSLADYDADTINRATYAVTIEPEGGSPTGVATGPIVYTGKLVESVPSLPAQPR